MEPADISDTVAPATPTPKPNPGFLFLDFLSKKKKKISQEILFRL